MIDAGDRETQEQLDPRVHRSECLPKCRHFLHIAAFDRCGIWNTPVRRHRLTRPVWAHFASGVVTDRYYEIQVRAIRPCKLIPALAAQAFGRERQLLQKAKSNWIDAAIGVASRAESTKTPLTELIDDGLSENAARRVPRAQKEHVVHSVSHRSYPPASNPMCSPRRWLRLGRLPGLKHCEIVIRNMDREGLHARCLLGDETLTSAGAHSGAQPCSARTQQFSVRNSISCFMWAKFGR